MTKQTIQCYSSKYFYFAVAISLGALFFFVTRTNSLSNALHAKPIKSVISVARPTPYKILIWTFGYVVTEKFLRSYGNTEKDPFAFCSVRNCILETSNDKIGEADAVMFHLLRTEGPHTLPKFHKPDQYWIFFTEESPLHTFMATKRYSMSDYNGLFNLSMTYRSDSDVPIPYGRMVRLEDPRPIEDANRNFSASKNKLVSVLASNCGSKNQRWKYIKELSRHIPVDIYGRCGTKVCPGHHKRDCNVTRNYKFYLAFENSNCREYITEKLWWNSYEKELVPVVMGASKEEYTRLAPPHSFIHVGDFKGPAELAKYLLYLKGNATAYNEYFAWKSKYKILNEHGYFGTPSLHICRMCEALNRLKGSSKVHRIYNDLGKFWNPTTDCRPPVWTPTNNKC